MKTLTAYHPRHPDPDPPAVREILFRAANLSGPEVSRLIDRLGGRLEPAERGRLALAWLEPMVATPRVPGDPPAGTWEFLSDRFRYGARWYDLTGQKLKLLEAFARARGLTLSHQEINQACADYGDGLRHTAYVSELNKSLMRLWRVSARPVRPVRGRASYRLHLPHGVA
jgi:hypothetical protein